MGKVVTLAQLQVKRLDTRSLRAHSRIMATDETMRVNVTFEREDWEKLMRVMARMNPLGDDGKPRGISIPDAIRESVRIAAGRK